MTDNERIELAAVKATLDAVKETLSEFREDTTRRFDDLHADIKARDTANRIEHAALDKECEARASNLHGRMNQKTRECGARFEELSGAGRYSNGVADATMRMRKVMLGILIALVGALGGIAAALIDTLLP